jgi:hypothetical protein
MLEYISKRSRTYAAADVADADGIKTSFATVAAPVALTVADWNGAAITAAGMLDLPRTITITRSAVANQYSVSPIVLTGLRGGVTVTESLTPANDDGGDVLRGTQAFDFLTSVAIPAQAATGGAFLIGVQDICAPANGVFLGVELAAAGTLNVGYGGNDSNVSNTDAIPIAAGAAGVPKPIQPRRILTSAALAAPTIVGLTVYL